MVRGSEATVVPAASRRHPGSPGRGYDHGAMSDPAAREESEPRPADMPRGGPVPDHQAHLGHMHVHDVDCGHPTVVHGAHLDYLHDEHRHAGHGRHYDEH